MPWCLLFLMAGMLSLRSGLFLLYQEKRKRPSAAVELYRFFIGSRGKPEPQDKNYIVILNAVKNPKALRSKSLNQKILRTSGWQLEKNSLYSMLSAPSYPAWQIFAGKSTEICTLAHHYPTAQGRIKARAVGSAKLRASILPLLRFP